MTGSKKPGRSRARRSGPGAGEGAQGDLLRTLERFCDQLQRVATTFERIGGLVERHLRGEQVQATPQPPAAATPVTRRETVPGQQLLPLEPERLLTKPTGRSQDPRGRPWSFGHLARVAGDLVRSDPDRTWNGTALCAALKEAGARVTSWRGLSFKLAAHLHKEGAVVLDKGNRFRAAVRPPEKPAVRRQEPSWDEILATARKRLSEVPTHVWTAAELVRTLKLKLPGTSVLDRQEFASRLMAALRAAGAIDVLDDHLFRARAVQELLQGRGRQPPGPQKVLSPKASVAKRPWPLSKLASLAESVLRREPDRTWSGAQVCAALAREGVRLDSWRGVAMQIIAELKRRGVIRVVTRSSFRVRGPAPAAVRKMDAPPDGQRRAKASEPAQSPPSMPWDAILAAARRCLEAEPGREWTWPELARAAREAGVASPTWKGVHIGLVAKLEALGLVERVDAQRVRVIRPPMPSAQPVPDAPEVTTATAPAGSEGEPSEQASPPAVQATADADLTPVTTAPLPSGADSVFALADEIEKLGPWLGGLSQRQRTAQVAAWAGRVRRLHETLGNLQADEERRVRDELRPMLGELARMARKHGCDWVDALSSAWEAEDWDGYIEYNHAVACGHSPTLAQEQEERYHRDRLLGLFNTHRKTARRDAPDTIREALIVLPESEAIVARAIRAFGRPPERRADPPRPAPPFRRRDDARARPDEPVAIIRDVPAEVLAITRGKRALIAGGQGSRESHRAAIQKSLRLERLEWVYGERGKESQFNALEGRIRPGRYDLVLLLASHSGHSSNGLVDACRDAGIPLVYLARGYSVTSVIEAIRQQVLARRVPEWTEQR